MTTPFYTHSGMAGAPQFSSAARTVADVLAACLVNGFNTQAPTSAAASGGVLTLNFGSAHGYEALVHITISGASVTEANGTFRVATVPAGNQLTCAVPGIPDGAVGGTISTKVAPAGWTEPFAADSTTRVLRMGGGNQRYLRIVQAASAVAVARAYEAMTDLGAGTEPFPTVAQAAGNGINLASVSSTNSWWCAATQKGFYLGIWTTSTGAATSRAGFFDLAEPVKAADTYQTVFMGLTASYIARSHTGEVGGVAAADHPITPSPTPTVPSPISAGQRYIFGVPLSAGSVIRGILPNAFNALPGIASASAGTLITSVAGVEGRVRSLHTGNITGLIAIALDEDWP